MNYLQLLSLVFGLIFFGSNQKNQSTLKTDTQAANERSTDTLNDKEEIKSLIKKVLIWSDTKRAIDLLPIVKDSKDSVYIGFDMNKLKSNLYKLNETSFFTSEFIENYDQIVLTLDKKLKKGEYDKWLVGDLPTFRFANDYDPWWNSPERFSLQFATIEIINLNKNNGEFYFKCGDIGHGCEGIENYKMRFCVVKEGNKWKISYLEGFDFKESTRKDGL